MRFRWAFLLAVSVSLLACSDSVEQPAAKQSNGSEQTTHHKELNHLTPGQQGPAVQQQDPAAAQNGQSDQSDQSDIDAATGLLIAPHWELAKAHCGACHSYRLVTAQRGDRAYWLKTIDWMQRTQNLWQIPQPMLGELVDYLATNYNETEWGRRPPLSPNLLPQG